MNKISFLLFLLFSPSLSFSEDITVPLIFNRENWNIAIESFSGSLPVNQEYLKSSVPDLIKQELLSSDIHLLSEREISHYRSEILKEGRKSLIQQISQNYESRDKIIFDGMDSENDRNTINERIIELKKGLMEIDGIDRTQINTADMLRVNWIRSSDDQDFLPSGRFIPQVLVKIYDLDFLITGSITQIEDYYLLEVSGYHSLEEEPSIVYSEFGSIDEIEIMAAEAADELRSIVLGRGWSILLVETNSPEALIYMDGQLIGVGSAEVKTVQPGKVLLEAIGEDNSYWSREADLTGLQHNEFMGILSETEKDFTTLDTLPHEADVYIGARWVGKTPLKLPRYRERNIWVTIRNEGYYSKAFEVTSKSPETLFYELEEEALTRIELFDLRKKEFYRALGWFSLSVAIPVVTQGMSENYLMQEKEYSSIYQITFEEEYNDLTREAYDKYFVTKGIFYGSLGLSGGLLANVFVKLARYIKAAEALAD